MRSRRTQFEQAELGVTPDFWVKLVVVKLFTLGDSSAVPRTFSAA